MPQAVQLKFFSEGLHDRRFTCVTVWKTSFYKSFFEMHISKGSGTTRELKQSLLVHTPKELFLKAFSVSAGSGTMYSIMSTKIGVLFIS